MAILIIAEHDHQSLKAPTLNTVDAALKLGDDIHILVAGFNASGAAEQASKLNGVSKVLYVDGAVYENTLAENISATAVKQVNEGSYSHVLAPASFFGKNALPRISALLDSQQISDVIEIISADTFVRPIYAGNALETVQSMDEIKVLTIRPTAFDLAAEGGNAEIVSVEPIEDTGHSSFIKQELTKSDRPDLGAASVVVSGGRGLGSAEKYEELILPLADVLNAATGASRAAVDAGWVPNDLQVGQTGKVVAPNLYIAVGISGAIQHLAGMKDSKVIVAINKDEEAPIFEIADYGIVGDLFEIVPELTEALSA
jgi:electron transfer flavoprotein alpha subunit